MKFRLAAYTDSAGKSNPLAPRNGNEDNMFVKSDLSLKDAEYLFKADKEEALSGAGCLLAVADGMGGMNAGEVASEIAVNVIKNRFDDADAVAEASRDSGTRADFMESVIIEADSAIKDQARADKGCEGMGSTAVLVWICGGEATVSWCGDSRAYLLRDGQGLKQISKDHSYVQELVDAGKITMDEAFEHPLNNIITRSLGDSSQKARPESKTIRLRKGDIILVNSDGLSGVLRDNEIEQIIRDNRNDLSSCRAALWTAAEAAGWYDNVTAILFEVQELDGVVNDGGCETEDVRVNSFIHFKIRKKYLLAICAALILVLAAIGFWFFRIGKNKSDENINTDERTELEDTLDTACVGDVNAAPYASRKSPEGVKIKVDGKRHKEKKDTAEMTVTGTPDVVITPESRLTPVRNDSNVASEKTDSTTKL